ncbi:MAG: glycogen/starch synthase [Candidatus Diapherotrites archaeon]
MRKPRILSCCPELMWGLDGELNEDLPIKRINFSTGGMAPVYSTYLSNLIKEGTFEVYPVVPKWESSLREFNSLKINDIKILESVMPDNIFFINHPSFNRVRIEGSNTKMYDNSWRFSSVDRALAFSSGIVNTVLPKVKPNIVWVHDWMAAPVATVAKAMGIKVVTTGHNPIYTELAHLDEMIYKGIELRSSDGYHPRDSVYFTDNKYNFMASAIQAANDFTTVSKGFLERLLYDDEIYEKSPSVIQAIRNKAWHFDSKRKKIDITHKDGRPRVHGYLNPLEKEKSILLESITQDGLDETIVKRKNNAMEVRKQTGLREGGELLIFPNRLTEQKAPELLIDNAIYLAEKYDIRILILANGEQKIIDKAIGVALNSNGLVSYSHFNKKLEELAIQSDKTFGVITSIYEPCGSPNINYPAEGTPIIGHNVDGIKDSVKQLNLEENLGNGFVFENNDIRGLEYGIGCMKEFANLPEKLRYIHSKRIAQESLLSNSASVRTSQLVQEVFLPLCKER